MTAAVLAVALFCYFAAPVLMLRSEHDFADMLAMLSLMIGWVPVLVVAAALFPEAMA